MARLRIRFELQRPQKGIQLPKLIELARETQRFLRAVADDTGLGKSEGQWVAVDFYNQGLGFDTEFQTSDLDEHQVKTYVHAVDEITSLGLDFSGRMRHIKADTLMHFAKVARIAGDGETVRIGLYNGKAEPIWKPLSKPVAAAILDGLQQWATYRGMIQGIIHSLYKEAEPPYFDIRNLSSRDLVKCYYTPALYEDVVASLERKDAVVIVSGQITSRRVDRAIREIKAERIEAVDPFTREDLTRFFGAAPNWTGEMTTEDFIDEARGGDGDKA